MSTSGGSSGGSGSVSDITSTGNTITVTNSTGPTVNVEVSATAAVTSVFTRTGAVVAASGDYTVAQVTGAAPLASPTFTGVPLSTTAAVGTNTTQIATTAFVQAQLANNAYATIVSPTLTGTPLAPTAAPGTNTTQIATTAFVVASFAPIASPTFTGIVTAPLVNESADQITAVANAATVPVTNGNVEVTNNSAATLTITLATASAIRGQRLLLTIYDFSAVAQTLTFVNTENSQISVPTTSNGSTTLPLTVGFRYNAATSKWRCLAVA
jgi:hypothetical protein